MPSALSIVSTFHFHFECIRHPFKCLHQQMQERERMFALYSVETVALDWRPRQCFTFVHRPTLLHLTGRQNRRWKWIKMLVVRISFSLVDPMLIATSADFFLVNPAGRSARRECRSQRCVLKRKTTDTGYRRVALDAAAAMWESVWRVLHPQCICHADVGIEPSYWRRSEGYGTKNGDRRLFGWAPSHLSGELSQDEGLKGCCQWCGRSFLVLCGRRRLFSQWFWCDIWRTRIQLQPTLSASLRGTMYGSSSYLCRIHTFRYVLCRISSISLLLIRNQVALTVVEKTNDDEHGSTEKWKYRNKVRMKSFWTYSSSWSHENQREKSNIQSGASIHDHYF